MARTFSDQQLLNLYKALSATTKEEELHLPQTYSERFLSLPPIANCVINKVYRILYLNLLVQENGEKGNGIERQ